MAMRYAGQGGITATCLWFKFFKEIDEDGSGRMMYDELLKMARIHLRMPETQVSDTQLQEVWRALDHDNSGFITAGEFGRFMRLGRERCAQCIAERLPGAAQALEREEGIRSRMSMGVAAAEEDRRYSISHTARALLPYLALTARCLVSHTRHIPSSHSSHPPASHPPHILHTLHTPTTPCTHPLHRHRRAAMLEEKQDQALRYLDEAARLEARLTFEVSIGKTSFTSASLSKLPPINSPAR